MKLITNFSNFIQQSILVLIVAFGLVSCGTPAPAVPTQSSTVEINTPAPTETNTPVPTETNTPPSPTATPTLAVTEIPASSNLSAEIDDLLNANADAGTFSGSVLIAQDGEILISEGYGLADREADLPNTSQTEFLIASITKQFTAAAIMLLQEEGKLAVQDAICDHLPDCPSDWEGITIQHLLMHTSGIPDLIDIPDLVYSIENPIAPMEILNYFIDMPLDFPSGEKYSYSNSGYIVLGVIIEEVAGQSYEAFLQENIFTPLELTSTGYGHHSDQLAEGYSRLGEAYDVETTLPYAAGGLYSTAEDLYLWDQAMHNGELLNRESLSQMLANPVPIPDEDGFAYGLGLIIEDNDGYLGFGHNGWIDGYQSILTHYPDEGLTIILLSNLDSAPLYVINDSLFSLVIDDE